MESKEPVQASGGGVALDTPEPAAPPAPSPASSEPPASEIDQDGKAVVPEPKPSIAGAPPAGGPRKPLPPGVKPKGSRFNERISDLVAQRRERDATIARLQAENMSLRGGPEPVAGAATGGKAGAQPGATGGADTRLSPEQFEDYGQYVQALVQQTIERTLHAHDSRRGQADMQQYRQERMSSFEEACEPLREQYGEDFDAAITDPTLPVTDSMADAILECENGPDVMLFLAANREEALKIARMNPRAATVAIGRIAAKIAAAVGNVPGNGSGGAASGAPQAAAPAAPARPAPSPVPAVRGSAPQVNAMPNDKMGTDDWLTAERARLKNKFGPRFRSY